MALVDALVPVLVSATVAGFVAWYGVQRQVEVKNVTEERAKWRDRIRSLAAELVDAVETSDGAKLRRIEMSFRLSLNPWDIADREIVLLLSRLVRGGDREADMDRIAVRLELLLKHDWERAKREASWMPRSIRGFTAGVFRPHGTSRRSYAALRRWRRSRPVELNEELPRV